MILPNGKGNVVFSYRAKKMGNWTYRSGKVLSIDEVKKAKMLKNS